MKLKNSINLKMNHFEFGYLFASIRNESWNRMPRALWLKLHITFNKAYLKHPTLGKQAKEENKKYKKELKEWLIK